MWDEVRDFQGCTGGLPRWNILKISIHILFCLKNNKLTIVIFNLGMKSDKNVLDIHLYGDTYTNFYAYIYQIKKMAMTRLSDF